jgi:hypothetical protein
VVTPARQSQSIDDALPATSVITRADIDRWQAVELVSMLSRETGVQFAQSGGRGAAASLFLRGSNSSQVLVLVDGVRLNAAPWGVGDRRTPTRSIASRSCAQLSSVWIRRSGWCRSSRGAAVNGLTLSAEGVVAPSTDARRQDRCGPQPVARWRRQQPGDRHRCGARFRGCPRWAPIRP